MSKAQKVLYAWELGEGLGHIAPFMPVARELERRGIEVAYALCHLGAVRGLFLSDPATLLQAPYLATPVATASDLTTYADLLLQNGWGDPAALASLLAAWRGIYEVVQPDLLITDHAPAAQAALHAIAPGGGLKRPPSLRLGSGFWVPQCATPLPNYLSWIEPPPGHVEQSDARARDHLNAALAGLGAAPVDTLARGLDSDLTLLTTFAELDPYHRSGEQFIGPILSLRQGRTPDWPRAAGKRVFAYLAANHPHFGHLFEALRRLGWPALLYVAQAAPALLSQTQAPNVRIVAEPLDMGKVTAGADIGVVHGGHGTTCDFLLAGKPLLVLADLVERGITARRIEEHGFGLLVRPDRENEQFLMDCLRRLAEDVGFTQRTAQFAGRHADRDQAAIVGQAVDACVSLLRATPQN